VYPQQTKNAETLFGQVDRRSLVSDSRLWTILGGVILALTVLFALCGSDQLLLVALGLLAVIVSFFAIRLCVRVPSWLLFALVLEEVLPYLNIIPLDPNARWVVRYPLLLPLTIPTVWSAIRTGVIRGWFKGYAAFLVWCAVTVAYSEVLTVSLGRLIPIILIFTALLVVVESVKSAADVQKLLGRFILGCALLQIIVVIAWLVLPASSSWFEEEGLLRFAGVFGSANELGALSMVTILAGIAHWSATSGMRRLLLGICIAVAVMLGAMADSRTVFIAITVGLVAYCVWKYRAIGAIAALISVCVLLVLLTRLAPAYLDRDITTMTGRTEAWNFEIIKLKQAPLLGYGFDLEGEIFQDRYFQNWETFWDGGANTPLHNSYLSVAIGCGVPALLALLVIVSWPWICLMRGDRDAWELKPLFFLIMIPMLVLGAQESGLGEPRYLKGILFFLGWMLAERYRQVQNPASARRQVQVHEQDGRERRGLAEVLLWQGGEKAPESRRWFDFDHIAK